jgi:hypothetical protein
LKPSIKAVLVRELGRDLFPGAWIGAIRERLKVRVAATSKLGLGPIHESLRRLASGSTPASNLVEPQDMAEGVIVDEGEELHPADIIEAGVGHSRNGLIEVSQTIRAEPDTLPPLGSIVARRALAGCSLADAGGSRRGHLLEISADAMVAGPRRRHRRLYDYRLAVGVTRLLAPTWFTQHWTIRGQPVLRLCLGRSCWDAISEMHDAVSESTLI